MIILTFEEAVKKAVESVGSFDCMNLPRYFKGREDAAALSMITHEEGIGVVLVFVVVWKNTHGIHCKKEVVPKKEGAFNIGVIPQLDKNSGEVIDILFKFDIPKAEGKWLN